MQHFSADKTYALFLNPINRKIISELETIGAKVVLFPDIQTRELQNRETKNLSSLLTGFNWLIFTDVYTVEFFLEKLQEEEFNFFELDEIRVCAYGESVADRLRFAQLHADIIPNNIKTTEILRTIKDYFIDEEDLKSARFLILKEKNATIEISNELENLGAVLSELPIYEIIKEKESETAKLKSLLKGGAIDEFIFTTPLDILNLAHLFPNENLSEVLAETSIYSSDNITTQSIQEFRLN